MNGAEDFVVVIEGLAETRSIESLPANIIKAAYRAINATASRTSTAARRKVREEVNFPAQYLTGTDSSGQQRLGVSKKANSADLEAVITGRQRPTSLARFLVGSPQPGRLGVSVQVSPGFATFMKRAFVIRLPAGRADIETKSNLGLAIRLKPGEVIHNKRVMLKLSGNLYLLFGPSVDQVFNTVREDVSPDASDFLGAEFSRLLGLDL